MALLETSYIETLYSSFVSYSRVIEPGH